MYGTEAHIVQWLSRSWGRGIDSLMVASSTAGDWSLVWWLICVGLVLVGGREGRRIAFWVVAAIVVSVAFDGAIKDLWFRPRPYMLLEHLNVIGRVWQNGSFPSGHASSAAAATTVLARLSPRAAIAAGIYGLLSCVSRPYLGMHWPTDVLGGLGTGMLAGAVVLLLEARWKRP